MKVEKAQFKSNKCGVTQSNCSLPPTDYSSKGGTLRLYVFILMMEETPQGVFYWEYRTLYKNYNL